MEKNMLNAKVYLAGAGPGDPGLITTKALQLITTADVILHDNLIPHELLALAKPNAQIISVAKSAKKHTLPQEKINSTLIKKAKRNKIVLRLKGGDPYLFGRGAEEAAACEQAGIEFEIVPGVTSALAAPAYAGIPPTHRDYASSVALITGHRKQEKKINIPKADTLIFLMGVANLPNIINALLRKNYAPETKIAAIQNATNYNQKIITGTLADFPQKAKRQNLQPPAVFIVGKIIELQKSLDWFTKKPKIFLPGTHPEKYANLGHIVHRPMIKLLPLDDYSNADPTLKKLSSFDWLVFTSTNGVKFFFQRLNQIGLDARALAPAKVAAMGKTTAEMLKDHGIIPDLTPKLESTAGLLDEFQKIGIKNKNFLLVRPQNPTSQLPDDLKNLNAKVSQVIVYKNVTIKPDRDIDFEHIDQLLFTSASTVRAFFENYSQIPSHIEILCLGQPTLDETKKYNLSAKILTNNQ
jgi:uroporphyrinogen III methyltransferase/synthase